MPLQRRHSGGGGNALDLDQFQHLEEIAEDDNMMIDCCIIPKVCVIFVKPLSEAVEYKGHMPLMNKINITKKI